MPRSEDSKGSEAQQFRAVCHFPRPADEASYHNIEMIIVITIIYSYILSKVITLVFAKFFSAPLPSAAAVCTANGADAAYLCHCFAEHCHRRN